MIISLVGLGVVMALLLFGLPLAFALGVVGYVGFGLMVGFGPSAAMSAQIAWDSVANYNLALLPMFLLMGNLVNHAGLSRELYDASNAFVGHRKGGLAMATIMACGGFAAVCGSSVATAATMAKIAMPPMRRYKYSEELIVGSVAAGGTLGIMIPPSAIMVIYGMMTESSIGKLYIAGIVPGLIGVLLYMGAVRVHTAINPEAGAAGPRMPWRERLITLRDVWPIVGLFVLVIGGIYVGIFAAAEASGIGAAGALLVAFSRGRLNFRILLTILAETARTTAVLMSVLVGALIFANFISTTGIAGDTVRYITELNLAPMTVMLIIIVIYLILGALMEELSMILLTIPVFFPLVMALGYDPVWFGIMIVVLCEVGMIAPPIGMNLFIIQAMSGASTATMYRGIWPFIAADVVRIAIILFFPALIMFLPNSMG